jgi:GNAT superfamily N-acetyltransferase
MNVVIPEIEISPLSVVEKINAQHTVAKFRCGKNSLDFYLKKHALRNQTLDSSQTYVVHRSNMVVGYYTLTYGQVIEDECPEVVRAQMPPYPIPVMLLARLAVHKQEKGTGLGKALLKDAFERTISAAEIAGLRAILVHALDDEAVAFYKHFNFEECPTSDRQLMIPMQDVRCASAAL